MSEPQRYSFGVHSLGHLAELKTSLESVGFACTVEVSTVSKFELHTVVAVPPTKENPIKFTRAL